MREILLYTHIWHRNINWVVHQRLPHEIQSDDLGEGEQDQMIPMSLSQHVGRRVKVYYENSIITWDRIVIVLQPVTSPPPTIFQVVMQQQQQYSGSDQIK